MRAAPQPALVAQPPPAAPPSSADSPAAAPHLPGLMAQNTTTAAGMVVASGVGHSRSHVITGGFHRGSNAVSSRHSIIWQEPQEAQSMQQQQFSPCLYEIKQLLESTQDEGDIRSVRVSMKC
ncbi:coiled-coil-helix-coiled-coil-helix domain-containing protein 2-like [Lepus europaeus]|uniref:coiled-coil-helix-coiled-coil-helix domain-containing protein 2-like n=1 Tax=Lepus europaeus TaxID=9983 RepID=UPI002B482B07|nr:coiled-coil-helix-coiled-coil-helix domain-containing protein 2-like [Lepus europaeus]